MSAGEIAAILIVSIIIVANVMALLVTERGR